MASTIENKDQLNTPTSGEAVKDLAAALAAPLSNAAAWTVVGPKGKKQQKQRAGKEEPKPVAGPSGTNARPRAMANAPGNSNANKLANNKKLGQAGAKQEVPRTDTPVPKGPGPSFFYKHRQKALNNKATRTEPYVPAPAGPAGLPVFPVAPVGCRGKVARNKQGSRVNRRRRASTAITKSLPAPAHNEPSKRTRLDDTVSPRGGHKKQKLDNTRRAPASYAEVAQSNLQVAVVRTDGQHITEEQATLVKRYLERRILEDVKNPSIDFSPRFMGRPTIAEGALKLWCEDEPSLGWLTEAIDRLPTVSNPSLRVIKQNELTRKVRAAIFIPECTNTLEDTSLVLANQNKWANIQSWSVYTHSTQDNDILFVAVGIPENLIPEVMKRGRRLAHNLGNVYIRFYGKDGGLHDVPPSAHKPESSVPEPQPGPGATQSTATGGTEKSGPATIPHSSPIPSCSKPMEVTSVESEEESDLEVSEMEEEEGNQNDGDPSSLHL